MSEEYLRSGENRSLTGDAFNIPEHAEGPALRRAVSDESKALANPNMESSDDILAKYRKKLAEDKVDSGEMGAMQNNEEEDCDPLQQMDAENIEASYVFQDARRKLRLVLSEVSGLAWLNDTFLLPRLSSPQSLSRVWRGSWSASSQ